MAGGVLVGREHELSALAALLDDGAVRLVTVTGPAGVGKTRVADAVAERIARDGRVRCVWVELAPLAEPALVAGAIAAAVGASDGMHGRTALEAAAAALGTAPALLVLDNFEHVEAAGGDVAALLDACPAVTVLVTSRHVLGLRSEQMFPLAPLALPEADERDASRAVRFAAVALFVARARAHDPRFELTDEVASAVVEICRRLDGLPLAIELVAARAAAVPPPALVTRWEDAIGLDTHGAPDLPPRQQTLRRALAWSYDLLAEQEQALLRRLAAFPAGFDLAAVEAACRGDGHALPSLDLHPIDSVVRLVDRSLVERRGGSATDPRYSQLATVRSFLLERLEAGGEAAAAGRIMADVVAAIVRRIGTFGVPRETLDALERELGNFHAALEVLARAEPAVALELACDLFPLWRTRRMREGREWVERALAECGPDLQPAARARALWTVAMLAVLQGDSAAVRRFGPASLAAAREAGDRSLIARASIGDAVALMSVEGHVPAARQLREALALAEQIGDIPVIAASCHILGEIARTDGDADSAAAYFERAYSRWREIGDATGVAGNAHNLAWLMVERGDLDRARTLLLEALAESTADGNRYMRAHVLAAVATVAARRSPRAAAATMYGAAQAELAAASAVLDLLEGEAFREARSTLETTLGAAEFAAARSRGRSLGEAEQQRLVERLLGSPEPAGPGPLTSRELEVVRLIAAGLTNGEIAERLVLSDHTVHRHVANILRKLDAPSRAAATSQAALAGLL